MSLATAAWDARAGRRAVAAAVAAALQAAFYWLILQDAIAPTAPPSATPLEITLLQTARRLTPAAPSPIGRREIPRPLAPREIPLPPAIIAPITAPKARALERVPHAPVDWQQAIRDEVRAQAHSAPSRLQFGFPRSPPQGPAAPPAFGWDYARTHRLEELPEGGTLINLTDRCALVVYVLLIPVCKIGRMPANGLLFEHIHDRRSAPPSGLP